MIGVIADDLTGAAELGAVGKRRGLKAEILLGYGIDAAAELVCIDTDSRSCAPAEAARRAATAADFLRKSGATFIYKKVDSVLRGQVRPEIEGILQALGLKLALLMPANPSLGRTIHGGQYSVRGQLLHETEFARDPENPRRTSDVLELLRPSSAVPAFVRRSTEPLPAQGIIIGEIETTDDLRRWAERSRDGRSSAPGPLLAGGAEFFNALLTEFGCGSAASLMDNQRANPSSHELFVCGSTSESSRAFVQLARAQGTPVFSLPEPLAAGAPFTPAMVEANARKAIAAARSAPRVILNVGLPPVSEAGLAKRLAMHLAQVAERVLRETPVDDVYAEGGATALELVRRMAWTRLTVLRGLALGVATLDVGTSSGLRLTIKPGTYVWPEELRRSAG
jgi:D-threonate/D-erythronate kinase